MNKLSADTAKLISSLQVITCVENVVKELVENSLDAEATCIEVKLENFGLGIIEVRDNGSGIKQSDMEFAAQNHHTSKLSTREDLNSLTTYGFRGEALSALCEVAEVSMTTRTNEDRFSTKYDLNHQGHVIATRPSHGGQGTTVIATSLFHKMPVRCQLYKTVNKQKQILKNVEDIIMAFSLVQHAVRFSLFHNKNLIWRKPNCNNLQIALENVFGSSTVSHMRRLEYRNEFEEISFCGFIPIYPDPNLFRKSCDRCFIYVNRRPVRDKEIEKILKSTIMQFHSSITSMRWPVVVLTIILPFDRVDSNLESNKNKVMISHKEILLKAIQEELNKIYSSLPEQVQEKENESEVIEDEDITGQLEMDSLADHDTNNIEDMEVPENREEKTQSLASEKVHYKRKEVQNSPTLASWSRGHSVKDQLGNPIEPVQILGCRNTISEKCSNNNPGAKSKNISVDSNYKSISSFMQRDKDFEENAEEKDPNCPSIRSGKRKTSSWTSLNHSISSAEKSSSSKGKNQSKKFKTNNSSLNADLNSSLITNWTSQKNSDSTVYSEMSSDETETPVPQRIIDLKFDMNQLTQRLYLKKECSLYSPPPKFSPVGALKDAKAGLLLSYHTNHLYLVNFLRLQETKLFLSLMHQHSLPKEELSTAIHFPVSSLSPDARNGLKRLESCPLDIIGPEIDFCDERIYKNGFNVSLFKDSEGEDTLRLRAISREINYYGWDDLVGILCKIGTTNNNSCTVYECRPNKVVHYLQAEAVRMSCSHPVDLSILDNFDATRNYFQADDLNEWKCFHNKPIFRTIFDFNSSFNKTSFL